MISIANMKMFPWMRGELRKDRIRSIEIGDNLKVISLEDRIAERDQNKQ